MSNQSVSCSARQGQRIEDSQDVTGKMPSREPEMLKLAGDMFDTWADQNGYPLVFAVMIAVVVDKAMQRRVTRQVAEVLRRNAEILDAAAASGVPRQPPQRSQ